MNPNEHYKNKLFFEAIERASFYRWCARKGFQLPGNDPLTGVPRDKIMGRTKDKQEESKVAYKAMARHWLTVAKNLREVGA